MFFQDLIKVFWVGVFGIFQKLNHAFVDLSKPSALCDVTAFVSFAGVSSEVESAIHDSGLVCFQTSEKVKLSANHVHDETLSVCDDYFHLHGFFSVVVSASLPSEINTSDRLEQTQYFFSTFFL